MVTLSFIRILVYNKQLVNNFQISNDECRNYSPVETGLDSLLATHKNSNRWTRYLRDIRVLL